jgi:hypothetical protein
MFAPECGAVRGKVIAGQSLTTGIDLAKESSERTIDMIVCHNRWRLYR